MKTNNQKNKRILKIGRPLGAGLFLAWQDALSLFEEVSVVDFFFKEKPEFDRTKSIFFFKRKTLLAFFTVGCKRVVEKTKYYRSLNILTLSLIKVMRLFIGKEIIRTINSVDYVHSSHNDFENANLLTAILLPFIRKNKKEYTLAYKESRTGYNYLEYINFKNADRVILNCSENLEFFRNKYSNINFDKKEIILDVDEDWKSQKCTIFSKHVIAKLSDSDNKLHLCILAGKVFSDSSDNRSGARLYYIDFIRSLIKNDIIVHLHTLQVFDDKNGVNQYELISEQFPEHFFIEDPLDETKPERFYQTLAKYDMGLLHMTIEGSSTSIFDKYNIPNRFYHYHIAKVLPIQKKGTKLVLEKYFPKSTFFYKELEDLSFSDLRGFNPIWEINSFKDYLKRIYFE